MIDVTRPLISSMWTERIHEYARLIIVSYKGTIEKLNAGEWLRTWRYDKETGMFQFYDNILSIESSPLSVVISLYITIESNRAHLHIHANNLEGALVSQQSFFIDILSDDDAHDEYIDYIYRGNYPQESRLGLDEIAGLLWHLKKAIFNE